MCRGENVFSNLWVITPYVHTCAIYFFVIFSIKNLPKSFDNCLILVYYTIFTYWPQLDHIANNHVLSFIWLFYF